MNTYRGYLDGRRVGTYVELKDKRFLQVYPARSMNIIFNNAQELATSLSHLTFDRPLPIPAPVAAPVPVAAPNPTLAAAKPAHIPDTEETKMKDKAFNISRFGMGDYTRLKRMDADDVNRISSITDSNLMRLCKSINKRIRVGKIYLMDKESGVAFQASGVVGFDGNSLLIFNER